MKRFSTLLTLILILFFSVYNQNVSAQAIKVIANSSVDLSDVSLQDLLFIYGLKNKRFSDGSRIVLFQFSENSDMNEVFYKKLGRDYKIFKNVWIQQQFKGEGFPPTVVKNQIDMMNKIKDTPGAIGFISASIQVGPGLKVLAEIPI